MPLYVLETLGLDQLRICKFGLELISKPERKCHIQIILKFLMKLVKAINMQFCHV